MKLVTFAPLILKVEYMTTTVKFNKLSVLIERFPDYIEIIKDSYLELLSELTEVSKLNTVAFLQNIQKISQMGTIIICFFVIG